MKAESNSRSNIFNLGLVVGKFAPLHRGHEWLIDQAAAQCEALLILSYSNPELDRCLPEARRAWLTHRFPDHQCIVIDESWLQRECSLENIAFRAIPANGASDREQQEFLGWLLGAVIRRKPDAFFCSEPYGPSCVKVLAEILEHPIASIVFDRRHVPISGTRIRGNPHALREWLSDEVRSAFVRRIGVVGGESSGKTTLSAALATQLETVWVPEYGRELWEAQSGVLTQADLMKIAREQIRREDDAVRNANEYLVSDTTPLTTAGYSGWMFSQVDPELAALAIRRYDALLLCRPDFPFIQDGTRRDERFRLQQHSWYQEQLRTVTCPVLQVGGSVQERVTEAVAWISEVLKPKPDA